MLTLGWLLGVIALKDLLVTDVPRSVLRSPSDFILPFLPWIPRLPATPVTDAVAFGALCAGIFAALLLVAGVARRAAASALLILYGVTFTVDQLGYTNNVFLLIVLLSLFVAEPLTPTRRAAVYPQRIVQLLITTMYATSGIVKLSAHWLDGSILRAALFTYHVVYPTFLGWDIPMAFRVGAVSAMFLELGLAFGLWNLHSRPWLMTAGVLFHLAIDVLMPVRMFSYLAPAAYVAFVPVKTLALAARCPLFRTRVRTFAVGILMAIAIDFFFLFVLRVGELPQRNLNAGLLALVLFLAAHQAGFLRDRGRAHRVRLPAGARAAAVLASVLLELFLVTKPLLGFTNRFGWRMFTEELELRASCEVFDGGRWMPSTIDRRWSDLEFRRYWDSLSEQRNFLEGYARWRLRRDPSNRPVCVRMTYRLNGATERSEDLCTPAPGGLH